MSTLDNITAQEWAQYSSVEHDELIRRSLFEKELATKVGMKLHACYPGYDWHVEVESRGGMVHVRNLSLNGNWGYDVHIKTVQNDVDLRQVMLAGGEILERYFLRASARRDGDVEQQKRDLRGDAIGDHSAAA